jgi:hypothetical protein
VPGCRREVNGKTEKRTRTVKSSEASDDMRREYCFDYSKAKPNRFARWMTAASPMVVIIDADLAKVFNTPESVNRALRALISAVPDVSSKRRAVTK